MGSCIFSNLQCYQSNWKLKVSWGVFRRLLCVTVTSDCTNKSSFWETWGFCFVFCACELPTLFDKWLIVFFVYVIYLNLLCIHSPETLKDVIVKRVGLWCKWAWCAQTLSTCMGNIVLSWLLQCSCTLPGNTDEQCT